MRISDEIGKTWYFRSGSKKAELWTILHLPYTLMCLAFVVVGFAIQKPVDYETLLTIAVAYFLGLGIGAHALDQLPGMGSSYVKHLTQRELLAMGIGSLLITTGIGVYLILERQMWHFLWLVPLQTFFAVAYPMSKLFRGFFHNDFWFSIGFGFMPVVVGYYANTLSFSPAVLPFALLCALISAIEITLSRTARRLRKMGAPDTEETLFKVERALKLLCLTSYVLAGVLLWSP